jgi:Tfp pilus assembly protein PilF
MGHATPSTRYAEIQSLVESGNSSAALALGERLVAAQPECPVAHDALGLALSLTGATAAAAAEHRAAIALDHAYWRSYNHLGNVYQSAGRWDLAEMAYRHALSIQPTSAGVMSNYAVALRQNGKLAEATRFAVGAVAARPDALDVLINCGVVLRESGDLAAAELCYQKAIAISPSSIDARWNRAICQLLRGDYAPGFTGLELRWSHAELRCVRRHDDLPEWTGAPLDGRTLLIYTEQGLGDSLQFSRFIRDVPKDGGRIVVECEATLAALLRRVPGVDAVVTRGDPTDWKCDVQVAMMSLAHLVAADLDAVVSRPFRFDLAVSPAPVAGSAPPRVGIAWAGSPHHRNDAARSTTLEMLGPLLEVSGVDFVSLQRGPAAAQLETLPEAIRARVREPQVVSGSLEETAMIMADLDLIVTVDTAVAHLGGSIGRPTWILLPFAPDWRWMLGRADSPWYPTVTLIRQTEPGKWHDPIVQAAAGLRRLASLRDH